MEPGLKQNTFYWKISVAGIYRGNKREITVPLINGTFTRKRKEQQ